MLLPTNAKCSLLKETENNKFSVKIGYATFQSGQFGLSVSVWAVSVTGHFGLAVQVRGHFGHDISVHKQLVIFVY